MGLGPSEVVRGIHTRLDRLAQAYDADPEPVMQRPQLRFPEGGGNQDWRNPGVSQTRPAWANPGANQVRPDWMAPPPPQQQARGIGLGGGPSQQKIARWETRAAAGNKKAQRKLAKFGPQGGGSY